MGQKSPKPTTPTPEKKVEYKFLLLGSGESGKSTFHKQLRIILGESTFLQKEANVYINTIYANILYTINSIGIYFDKNSIKLEGDSEVKKFF